MKLLYCPACGDVFNLVFIPKTCSCGKTQGHYKQDGLHAEFSGGVPIGIHNGEFHKALQRQQKKNPMQKLEKDSLGERFEAWVCPANSTRFVKKRRKN